MITANFWDCTANSARLAARNPQKTAIRPDGGVVTQRTANPLAPRRNPPKFARFTACSPYGISRGYDPDCELFYLGDGIWWRRSRTREQRLLAWLAPTPTEAR